VFGLDICSYGPHDVHHLCQQFVGCVAEVGERTRGVLARRQGFGRMVVEELISRARKRGMAEIVVLTDTPWTSAVELYLACGFREDDRDDTDTHFAMAL